MIRIARLSAILVSFVVASLAFAAANLSLINADSMETYRRAVSESDRNRPKAAAFLKGLLVERLRVRIDWSTLDRDAYEFEDGVREAVSLWNDILREDVFELAQGDEPADIVVKFVERIDGGQHAQGMVRAERSYSWRGGRSTGRTTGTIYIRDNVGRRLMRQDEVARVMAHELGHLLGLDDLPRTGTLMGYFVAGRGDARPSREEVEAVMQFRDMVRQALRDVQ